MVSMGDNRSTSAPDPIDRFQQDGYVIFRQVIDADDDRGRERTRRLAHRPTSSDRRSEDLTHDLARTDAYWIDLVSDDPVCSTSPNTSWDPTLPCSPPTTSARHRARADGCTGIKTVRSGHSNR